MDGQRPGVRLSPPRVGEHNAQLLAELGYDAMKIEALGAYPASGSA
jgi:crotonobetainyl-CoA:carnitine CoA-transferase CaiB-like acyl-CoA transferase